MTHLANAALGAASLVVVLFVQGCTTQVLTPVSDDGNADAGDLGGAGGAPSSTPVPPDAHIDAAHVQSALARCSLPDSGLEVRPTLVGEFVSALSHPWLLCPPMMTDGFVPQMVLFRPNGEYDVLEDDGNGGAKLKAGLASQGTWGALFWSNAEQTARYYPGGPHGVQFTDPYDVIFHFDFHPLPKASEESVVAFERSPTRLFVHAHVLPFWFVRLDE